MWTYLGYTSVMVTPVNENIATWEHFLYKIIQSWVVCPQLVPGVDMVVDSIWRGRIPITIEITLHTFCLQTMDMMMHQSMQSQSMRAVIQGDL